MENLWDKAHKFILNSEVGDTYHTGGNEIKVIKRTPRRIYFSNGNIITIQKSKSKKFYFLNGKKVNQILRDIEGYLLFQIHCQSI
jgi:hypothetical protein